MAGCRRADFDRNPTALAGAAFSITDVVIKLFSK
jgi:hypothetical protein